MIKRLICLFVYSISSLIYCQTTDLATSVEAQNLGGTSVSQVTIYEEFQYITTIINSGNEVNNVLFSQTLNNQLIVQSFNSQNATGGSSDVSNLTVIGDQVSGTIANMPGNSSVEVKITVIAPAEIGGIATTASVFPPNGTTDTNLSNNDSVISIDVIDTEVDFSVVYSQITPPQGTGISAWGEAVTYEFTITNNSDIAFPLSGFLGNLNLISDTDYGQPVVQFQSIECVSSTNGTECPDLSSVNPNSFTLSSAQGAFSFTNSHLFTAGGSLTFRIVYEYSEPLCAQEQLPIIVESFIELDLDHDNQSPNTSNVVITDLLIAELCGVTDVCIETIQVDPTPGTVVDFGDEITFQTTICNNGPNPAPIRFFLQNLTAQLEWDIISVECLSASGVITCDDIVLSIGNQFWTSNNFFIPVGVTIVIETVIIFNEPECAISDEIFDTLIRSSINILDPLLLDEDLSNNFDFDTVAINPGGDPCPESNLQISKTQIAPILPEGGSDTNTTTWGNITYEITATNPGENDVQIELIDFMTSDNANIVTGSLVSVNCVSTTGTANCGTVNNANIGVVLDGISEVGELEDIFWQISEEDNWILPAQSSITFHVIIDWEPICSIEAIPAINEVTLAGLGNVIDDDNSNNSAVVTSYFAPCIDLVVQTFPEFTQVGVNAPFNWIIDISNSATSSPAIDAVFQDVLEPLFTINGTPTCTITSGNATCISSFNVNGNSIDGIIPFLDQSASIRIEIPVIAPSTGGAYINTAEAIPSAINNEELTPETNISISSVQVVSPTLSKAFNPSEIISGEESTLTFTVQNTASNPAQSSIQFSDNLPTGVVLSGSPFWSDANGCTANFIGGSGDTFIRVENLIMPQGVDSCSFSVIVTSNDIDLYTNNNLNFSDQINIDTSETFATLNVIEDPSNVDIEVIKTVSPSDVALGEQATFTITVSNLGTTTGTQIEIQDLLPLGYEIVSYDLTDGNYNQSSGIWQISSIDPGNSVTLHLLVNVIANSDLLNVASLIGINEPDRDESNNESSAEVTINNCLEVSQGFSPNEDQFNPYLTIPCIEDYPQNRLKIFNRLGVLIFESDNYQNDWDGKPNRGFPESNKVLPVGTYFYILEGIDIPEQRIGWLYLNY